MAELSFDRNAKLITVLRPALEITIQELYNKIKEYEDDQINMDLPQIATASGKEPLGGSVFVGITLTLLDGWRITFQDSPDSPVQEVADVTGGNIVAQLEPFGTENPTFQNPIAPAGNLVITKTSSSSATLLSQAALQFSSFQGAVHVDVTSSTTGTQFPRGTGFQPVNNIPDAVAIAEERGIEQIHIIRDITLDTGDDVSDFIVVGENINRSTITVNPGAVTTNTEFRMCVLTGTLDGGSIVRDATLRDVTYLNGIAYNCILEGTITLGGNVAANFFNCFSGSNLIASPVDDEYPVIDLGGSGQGLSMQNYNGGIRLRNKTGPESIVLDINVGDVVLENTVDSGRVVLRGIGGLTDLTTSPVLDSLAYITLQVDNILACCRETRDNTEAILVIADLIRKYDGNRTRIDPIAQTLTVYEDDGVTPLTIFELKDEDGNLSVTEVYERDPVTDRGSPPDGSPLV